MRATDTSQPGIAAVHPLFLLTKKRPPLRTASFFIVRCLPCYFAFGVSATAGFTSLPVFFSSVFLASGVAPGLVGETAGVADGLWVVTGVVAAVGAGVAVAGGLVGGVLGAGVEQAPITATLAAKTVDNIIDLLIVNSFCLRPP